MSICRGLDLKELFIFKSKGEDLLSKVPTAPYLNLSSNQNPGSLLYVRDFTTQVYGDYNKPLLRIPGSLLINQDSMECQRGFEHYWDVHGT